MTDEQLDTIGFSQYPYGSDPDDPYIDVLSGSNLEFIHHMAEIALLRDLWRALHHSGVGPGAIARRMGVHTARRRISQLLDSLNAETRFQAGAQAILRGWLDV